MAPLPGTSMKRGIRAIGIHNNWAGNQADTAMSLRRLKCSTNQMEGIWTTCMAKGKAARIPICRLLAPRTRAKAVRKPLVVMLKKPMEKPPSRASQRRPLERSFSDMVGLGARNFSNPIFDYSVSG